MFQASRLVTRMAPRVRTTMGAKRSMGGHAEVQYEGFEAKVRQVLPKDEHIVFGIMGMYFSFFLLFKAKSAMSGPAPEAPKVAAAPVSASSAIPSVEDENFGKWIEDESNLGKLISSIEK